MHIKVLRRHFPCFIWLLLLSIALRSLIAPGYMLDFGTESDPEITVTLCAGFNGINAIEGITSTSTEQHNHHNHHGDTNEKQEHSETHITATCGLWFSSTTFVATGLATNISFYTGTDNIYSLFSNHITPKPYYSESLARAPPTPSFS